MAKRKNHTSLKKISPSPDVIGRFKKRTKNSDKKLLFDKNILHKLFHPNYILFDWEYFSRELEFE